MIGKLEEEMPDFYLKILWCQQTAWNNQQNALYFIWLW